MTEPDLAALRVRLAALVDSWKHEADVLERGDDLQLADATGRRYCAVQLAAVLAQAPPEA